MKSTAILLQQMQIRLSMTLDSPKNHKQERKKWKEAKATKKKTSSSVLFLYCKLKSGVWHLQTADCRLTDTKTSNDSDIINNTCISRAKWLQPCSQDYFSSSCEWHPIPTVWKWLSWIHLQFSSTFVSSTKLTSFTHLKHLKHLKHFLQLATILAKSSAFKHFMEILGQF